VTRPGADHGALFHAVGRSIQAQGVTPDIEVLQDVPDEFKVRSDTRERRPCAAISPPKARSRPVRRFYVPPDEKNDKALAAAFDLLRGVTVKADMPSPSQGDGPN